jgi:hypothetical protein
MMRTRVAAIALALLLQAAGAAGAQRVTTTAGAALADLDSATSSALLRDLERAGARGLPTDPLIAKVREGRLKRASGARIRQAVAALATRLDSARAALGAEAAPDELTAGADALAAGAVPDALRALRLAATQRALGVPLGALAQLVASGVPSRRATAMIVELLRRNVAAAQVVAFGNAVETDAAGGLPAEESAIFRLRAASAASADALTNGLSAPSSSGITSTDSRPPAPSSTSPRRRP